MTKFPLFFFLFAAMTVAALGSRAQLKTAPAPSEQARFRAAAAYSQQMRGLSVLVMRGGKIVFEESQNGHSATTPHLLASGTKSFNGVMAAAAVEDGILKFDERVCDTISEWKTDSRRAKITVRQLLSLTSGLEPGRIGSPPGYAEAIAFAAQGEPGAAFEYSPAPFQVWGELMRRKLAAKQGTPLDYLQRRVLKPIGLEVAFWRHRDGQPILPSGAALTAREWAKLGQFVLQNGQWNGKQIVAKKYLDECFVGSRANPNYGLTWWLNRSHDGSATTAPADNTATGARLRPRRGLPGAEPETTQISQNGFGAGFPKDMRVAAGAGKQRLYIFPSLDLVVVRQGEQARFDDVEFLRLLLGIT